MVDNDIALCRAPARPRDSDATILLPGEIGPGTELVARAIHRHGRRAKKPLVPVDRPADVVPLAIGPNRNGRTW